jgi:hypothetical protein
MTIIKIHTPCTTKNKIDRCNILIRTTAALTLCLFIGSGSLTAQARSAAYAPVSTPRVEIFGGYSYLYPDTVASGLLPGGLLPVSSCLCAIPKGAGLSVTIPITRWIGATVDASGHWGGQGSTPAQRAGNADAYNIAAGPQFILRTHHFSPFAEALFGADRLAPSEFHQNTAFGIIAGGGLDVPFGRHISLRPVQADFVYSNHSFGPSPTVPATNLRGLRLQAGLVFSFGGKAPFIAPAAVQPAIVAPVIVTPAPVVAAPVDVVTLAAVAVPAQINAGESSTISANGVSALGRPLTYSFSSDQGVIAAEGTTAILNTAGLGAGTARVTVNVANDLGQHATQIVPVTLIANVLPAVAVNHLGDISYARDQRRPARVNNEAKAFLDVASLSLQRSSTTTMVLIGYASASERNGAEIAVLRARNAKAYLVDEKGIDPARITLYTGHDDAKKVNVVMVPAGASFDTNGLVKVEPSTIERAKPAR